MIIGSLISVNSKKPWKLQITSDTNLTIGTGLQNTVSITDSRLQSTQVEFTYSNLKLIIVNYDDIIINGKFINRGQQTILQCGDEIILADDEEVKNRIGYIYVPEIQPKIIEKELIYEPAAQYAQGIKEDNQLQWLKTMKEEFTCPICTELLTNAVFLNCGHLFCEECIQGQFQYLRLCPCCRKQQSRTLPAFQINNILINIRKFINYQEECEQTNDLIARLQKSQNNTQIVLNQNILREKNQILDCKSCEGFFRGFQCRKNTDHEKCNLCYRLIPIRELTLELNNQQKIFCLICKKFFCQYWYRGTCAGQKDYLKQLLYYVDQFILNKQIFNQTEIGRIMKHLKDKPISFIFNFMVAAQITQGTFEIEIDQSYFKYNLSEMSETLWPISPVCQRCFEFVNIQIVIKYVQQQKDEIQFQKEECQFGINCSKQYFFAEHQKKFSHLCRDKSFD